MGELKNGMLVRHASLGLGKVVALEAKAVHVFFAASEERFATKLRLPLALPLLTPAVGASGWLSGLADFALDAKTGRYGLAATWLSHADAVARFREVFPGGFEDPGYAGDGADRRDRAARWRRAHEAYVERLGGGEGERLLAAGEVGELVERSLVVERLVRPLLPNAVKASFEEALADLAAARGYFAALFDVLAAPAPDATRFEALAAAVEALPSAHPLESSWPIATLLPFIARPDVHMALGSRSTCDLAHRLGHELAYDPRPNWATYSALLASAATLLEKLRPLGARDHVDVDAFMHVVTTKRPAAKAVAATKGSAAKGKVRLVT